MHRLCVPFRGNGWLLRRRPRSGFSLVELLVVVAILALLVALLLPSVQSSREAARRAACQNNLRQLGIALCAHETASRAYPVGCLECDFRVRPPRRRISWMAYLLPFVEYADLADQLDWSASYHAQENLAVGSTVLPFLFCPSTSRTARTGPTTGDVNGNGRWDRGDDLAFTDYAGIFGVGHHTPEILPEHRGVMIYEVPTTVQQITDGLSHTAILGECTGRGAGEQSEWINGHNIFDQQYDLGINVTQDNELWSDHPGGVQLTFCDAHVRFIPESIDQQVLLALLTRQGND